MLAALAAGVFVELRVGFDDKAGVAMGNDALGPGCNRRFGRGAGRGIMAEAAILEDFADDLFLAGFDEGDDFYRAAALGAAQRVGLVNALDQDGPPPEAVAVGLIGMSRMGGSSGFCVVVLVGLFGAEFAELDSEPESAG